MLSQVGEVSVLGADEVGAVAGGNVGIGGILSLIADAGHRPGEGATPLRLEHNRSCEAEYQGNDPKHGSVPRSIGRRKSHANRVMLWRVARIPVHSDDRVCEGSRGFLGKVVPDPSLDQMV